MTSIPVPPPSGNIGIRTGLIAFAAIVVLQIVVEWLMGRIWICSCGTVKLWEGGVKTGKLGDMAWLDENENGLQDSGEPGIPGLTVLLMQDGVEAARTTTDAYGYYLFESVYPMASQLRVSLYPELLPTKLRDDFPMLVSKLEGYEGNTAYTVDVMVESDGFNFDCDLGFMLREGAKKPSAIVDPPKQKWE